MLATIRMRRGLQSEFEDAKDNLQSGEIAVTTDTGHIYMTINSGNIKRLRTEDDTADIPIATTEIAGKVKPDGTSITVDEDGTIHSVGGGVSTYAAETILAEDLLWTNTSPNDVFEAQTINLDLSQYDYVDIVVKGWFEDTNYRTNRVEVDNLNHPLIAGNTDGNNVMAIRGVVCNSTGVTFTLGASLGGVAYKSVNMSCIPLSITGIKKAIIPFRLGIDEAGNYGYYKIGSNVLTPF